MSSEERLKAFRPIRRGVRDTVVMAQLTRPSFRAALADLSFAYIPFSELQGRCGALCRFGADHTAILKIARQPVPMQVG